MSLQLLLSKYYFDRVLIEANGEWPQAQAPLSGVKVEVEVGARTDDPTRWRISLAIRDAPNEPGKPTPYKLDVRLHGFFQVDARGLPQEQVARVVQVNGASILYSAAREFVLLISARNRFGQVMLPTLHFQAMREPPKTEAPERPAKSSRSSRSRPKAAK